MYSTHNAVIAVGFDPQPGIPLDDYKDLVGLMMNPYEYHNMQVYGHFPPGLICEREGHREIIEGEYFTKQHPRVIS
jgi:hypothetical protein